MYLVKYRIINIGGKLPWLVQRRKNLIFWEDLGRSHRNVEGAATVVKKYYKRDGSKRGYKL